LTVLQRSSLANHIRRLRIATTGARKASYRDLARATGIPLSVLHAIAKEKIVIPDWIAKLEFSSRPIALSKATCARQEAHCGA
jgi:hypothetical protein